MILCDHPRWSKMKIYKECLSNMNINDFFEPVLMIIKNRYPEAKQLKESHTRFVWIAKYNIVETFKQFSKLKKELSRPKDYEIQMIIQKNISLEEKAQEITDYVARNKERIVWKPNYELLESAKLISAKHYYKTLQTIKCQELWWGYLTCPFKNYIYKFVLNELRKNYQ